MKEIITINRHNVAHNKKVGFDEKPCISIRNYKQTRYARRINLKGGLLIQDMENARCNGASIWIEADSENVEIVA